MKPESKMARKLIRRLEDLQGDKEFKKVRKPLAFAAMWFMTYPEAVECPVIKQKWVEEFWDVS